MSIHLLGHFALTVGGTDVDLAAGPQRLAAYLALRGVTTRCRVAGELWPEATQSRAMHSLRTAIWRINQATHGLVHAAGGALDLDPAADVDVRQMLLTSTTLLTTSSPPGRGLPPDVDLLPMWDDQWLVHDRERVRQLQLHLLEASADRLSSAGQYGLALEWALAAVRADPLRESAHRSVIRIHVAEGNLAEARRAYDTCADLLQRELGVRPSARTSGVLVSAVRDVAVTGG
ncbi:AfsR/SARP family transcriptional regulator [Nocardioides coralli]|uniref:AfsR/SARP family transcriptional regulator n=1 Tax=Nocardioides coralli TaxID=2872154 RepID=UPI001CA3A954|nr:BTAD domain-containing putative transcriptional regulator [Nocardioides coralli]QZY28965.1 hypothetical protein K6T13_16240 [Nocardioides coralli]